MIKLNKLIVHHVWDCLVHNLTKCNIFLKNCIKKLKNCLKPRNFEFFTFAKFAMNCVAFVWNSSDLQCKIFTYLDSKSLIEAEHVNKIWKLRAHLPASVEYLNFNQFFEPETRSIKDSTISLFRYSMVANNNRFEKIKTFEWNITKTLSWYKEQLDEYEYEYGWPKRYNLKPDAKHTFWRPNDVLLFKQFETWNRLENIILKFGTQRSAVNLLRHIPTTRQGINALYSALAMVKKSDKIKSITIDNKYNIQYIAINNQIERILFKPNYNNLQSIQLLNICVYHDKNIIDKNSYRRGERMFLCHNKFLKRICFHDCDFELSFWFDFASKHNESFKNVEILSMRNDRHWYCGPSLNRYLRLLKKYKIMQKIGSKFINLKSIEFRPFGKSLAILLQSIIKSQFENNQFNLQNVKITVGDMQSMDPHLNDYAVHKLLHVEITVHLEWFVLRPSHEETFLASVLNLLIASKVDVVHSTNNPPSEYQSPQSNVMISNENQHCPKYENRCESIKLTFSKECKRKSSNFNVITELSDKLDAIRFVNLKHFSLNLCNLTIKTCDFEILTLIKSLNQIYKQRCQETSFHLDLNVDVWVCGDLFNFYKNEIITMCAIVDDWCQYGLISINIQISQKFKPKFEMCCKNRISRLNQISKEYFATNVTDCNRTPKIDWSIKDGNETTFMIKIEVLDSSITF